MRSDEPKLPRRIPDGTRYVVEGEPIPGGTRLTAAYLIFPSGQRVDLPVDSTRIVTCACASVSRPGQPRRTKISRRIETQPATARNGVGSGQKSAAKA